MPRRVRRPVNSPAAAAGASYLPVTQAPSKAFGKSSRPITLSRQIVRSVEDLIALWFGIVRGVLVPSASVHPRKTWPSVSIYKIGFRHVGMEQWRIVSKCIHTE